MGRAGGGFWGRSKFAAVGAVALAVAACASGPPPTMFDLAAATPPPARGLRAQIRVGQPTATANLDSDRILVRDSDTLAILEGARWSESLPALFRTRLAQSFQNAGPRPLDRRPGGERGLRDRSRHPRLRARRPDERSPCRHRRLDRLAWERADQGGPDFHPARAACVNRPRGRRRRDGSGGFDRHDRNRQIRRQDVMRPPPGPWTRRGADRRLTRAPLPARRTLWRARRRPASGRGRRAARRVRPAPRRWPAPEPASRRRNGE